MFQIGAFQSNAFQEAVGSAVAQGGHGSEPDWKRKRIGQPWGNPHRRIVFESDVKPKSDEMEMIIHLINLLDDE